jgi:glycosyltransferase involved in cell wall biosynthesis
MISKKIAIYSGEIPSTTFVDRLVDGLAVSGHQIYLFGSIKRTVKYHKNVTIAGYKNRFEKVVQFFYYTIALFLFQNQDRRKLNKLLKAQNDDSFNAKSKYYPVLFHRPEIFHLQWAKGVGDWMWVREFGIRLVLSLRGTHITISPIGNDHWKETYTRFFPEINGFHAVSNATGRIAGQYGANPANIKTVYSGFDFEKMPFRLKEKINTPLKIVSIGRSHWVKGYHYALDAFTVLQDRHFNFEYSIIGVGTDEELILQRSQLNLENKVHFVPPMPFSEVLLAVQNADILVLSSVEEGIANVVLEAMSLGTLVIATLCGGMDEVITDGHNGFLVPIRDPKALADALQKAAGLSVSDYQRMCLAARETIESQHNNQKMIADMTALYTTVLNGPS